MRVRRVTIDDIPTVAALEKRCFSVPWSEESFISELDSGDAHFILCEEGEELLGFAVLHFFLPEAELFNIAAAPEARRKGVGRALMEDIFRGARRNDISRIFLEVRRSNQAAISLYEKFGFQPIGLRKDYYEQPVEDAILMEAEVIHGEER